MTYQLNFSALWPYMPELLAGLLTTMALTALATLMGVALGICGAAIRSGRAGALSRLWGVYVEVVRNTPFVVQLFFIVFGLPSLGWKLTAGQAALLAMVINLGAYSTEIIRAGIQVTPKGQWEAGRVLGLSRSQTFTHRTAAVAAAYLSGVGEPVHHRDAGILGGVAGLVRRADLRRQPDPVAHLPQL